MTDSILDKIIDSKHQSKISDFDPVLLLEELLQLLDEREQQVLSLRYGFDGGAKHTLEDIGKKFDITRERVRQIESSAVKKLRKSEVFEAKRDDLVELIEEILSEVGGIMAEERLHERLNALTNKDAEAAVQFLMNKLMADYFSLVKQNERMVKSWAKNGLSVENYERILDTIGSILERTDEVLTLLDLHEHLHKHEDFLDKEPLQESVLENMLHLAADIKSNPFGQWGKKHWPLISPRRMNDKIYLVLKHHGEPIHFTDIAKKINETNFDHKKAHPATVHNELILDNDRYVLIGRGIYALKEWGYKAGVVTDIIVDVIKDHGPMSREEIIEKVLEQRMVKKSTIVLMLTNKSLFKKLPDGRYDLAESK